jgi:hypothetical protein
VTIICKHLKFLWVSIKFAGGCCWPFAVVVDVEAIHKIQTRELLTLSEQQLINCALRWTVCVECYQLNR